MELLGCTVLTFSWMDRLRVLFGKKVHVDISSSLDTAKLSTDFRMETRVFIDRIRPQKSSGAYGEAPTPSTEEEK